MIEWKQREIKFKFWARPHKHMMDDYDGWSEDVATNEHFEHFKEFDIIPLQYTGLKDKNGKEIYEGDIARDISGKVAVIVYSPPSFFAQFKGELWDINTKGSPDEMVECIEVLGNIFENPELLEDKP